MRVSLAALLVSPAKAPAPPRISSTASAAPHAGLSYLASADHSRQARPSTPSPGQLVPAGLFALMPSRPKLKVAPTVRPAKVPRYAIALSARAFGTYGSSEPEP